MDSRNNEKKSSIPVEDYGETPPAYEAEAGPSTVTQLSISHSETRPTTESPFTFPINAPLPPYSASSSNRRPIAVPQAAPIPASPLLSAYPPALLHYGIPKKTWLSFLETISAFLTAKVSRRALNHAADMAKQVGDGPNRLFKNLVSHTKDVGSCFRRYRRRSHHSSKRRTRNSHHSSLTPKISHFSSRQETTDTTRAGSSVSDGSQQRLVSIERSSCHSSGYERAIPSCRVLDDKCDRSDEE